MGVGLKILRLKEKKGKRKMGLYVILIRGSRLKFVESLATVLLLKRLFSEAAGGFTVKYGGKDTINWCIAGPDGLTIIEVYNPHFTSETEAVVEDDDPSVSPKFWEVFHRFKEQASKYVERYTLN